MSAAVGRLVVVPALDEFHEQYPDIELALGVGDRLVDLVQEGIDCALRIGNLEDSTLVARRIGLIPLITAASPAYLARAGTPASPRELQDHLTVNYFSSRTGRMVNLEFCIDGGSVNVKLPSRLAANDGDMLMQCGARGLGLIQVPEVLARPYLERGELVEILADWRPAALPISAVFPQSRHLSPQVRAFVNWVADVFERHTATGGPPLAEPLRTTPH
jgi:LysR family transcriptional regulator for bpeEF and oprC